MDRLIAQYCKPYKTVDLSRMASAFSLEQDALEDRVARLVGSGQLGDLRVDLVDHALRSSTSSKGRGFERCAREGQFVLVRGARVVAADVVRRA